MNDEKTKQSSDFEQDLVNQLARDFLHEQRQNRRWSVFFKSLLALYLFALLIIYMANEWAIDTGSLGGKHTALVDIEGVISADSEASADFIVTGLRAAFEDKNTSAVIIRINSPGGSPVQAGYINDEIHRLKEKHPEKPVYAVISDVCASGGYYIAVAADEIYADKASVVGSIGVIMAGFGFVDAIDKLGIERRLQHAGESKAFLDPFSPLKQDDVAHIDDLLDEIYMQFIDIVKEGRGDRLKIDDSIFSGLVWTGEKSVEMGLIDGLGSASYVAREIVGEEDIVDFTRRESYIDRFARKFGSAVGDKIYSTLKIDLK